jgi:hypothetical protein
MAAQLCVFLVCRGRLPTMNHIQATANSVTYTIFVLFNYGIMQIRHPLLVSLVMLLLGTINYYIFRSNIYLFDWLHIQGIGYRLPNTELHEFCKNYLSDFFWILFILFLMIWMRKKNIPALYGYLLLALPIVSEIGQYYKIFPGTFDWVDILIYIIVILPFVKLPNEKNNRPSTRH